MALSNTVKDIQPVLGLTECLKKLTVSIVFKKKYEQFWENVFHIQFLNSFKHKYKLHILSQYTSDQIIFFHIRKS